MSEEDIFQRTGDAYLHLIHPVRSENRYRLDVAPVLAIAGSVPDDLISNLIGGPSWRERLLGLCIGMHRRPNPFVQPMLRSLADPRGISIVPTCAALAVLAKCGSYAMPESFAGMFNRAVFDGEIGWAAQKALSLVGLRTGSILGRGPNYGQVFEDHLEVYSWIQSNSENS